MKKTKVIATLGPASDTKDMIKALMLNGMDVVRLNMSHGTYDEQKNKIDIVRNLNQELNKNVALLLDTKGPEVRTGKFEDDVVLQKGQEVIITMDEVIGTTEMFTVSYKGLVNDITAGDTILLDDGYVSVEVLGVNNNQITCKVLNTGKMKDRRGVNVPGVTLNFEFMSEKDKSDIEWACDNNLDYIAASFVRNKKDLEEIKSVLINKNDKHIQIVPKIESKDGVENIDEIIINSDGIMIARGDLGVEIPPEEVPVIQKSIIEKCNKNGKFVITATQMLESMQSNPRPTRAEVSDVFNAVMDGTDAVMLSGESAAGEYPVESVQMQSLIAERAETAFDYQSYLFTQQKYIKRDVTNLVAHSTVTTADALDEVKLIIAITESGNTARIISRLKPKTPILALTHDQKIIRKLALNYGVTSVYMEKTDKIDDILNDAIQIAKDQKFVKSGDEVAISAGSINQKGKTDLMRIVTVK